MDRPTTRKDADARGSRPAPHEAFVLPSRRSALDLCRSLLKAETPVGPILLTGDAGIGKTWLCGRLATETKPHVRWVGVDLTPANTPADLYRLLAHELGLADSCASASSRVDLIDFLAERQTDGQRLILVIDEAQNLSMPVWEEVRVLANRLDRPGGFSRMILVGQTSLVRRFATRPFSAIENRLALKIHLGPIDADEAAELLAQLDPGRTWSVDEVDTLHRDSVGNPRRLLRKLGTIAGPGLELTMERNEVSMEERVAPTKAPLSTSEISPSVMAARAPLTGPDKPPIRVDENMIEVGWSPDDLPDTENLDDPSARGSGSLVPTEGGEEAVHDHLAALQAWREWTENQSKRSSPSPIEIRSPGVSRAELADEDEDEIEEDLDDLPALRPERPRVRVEGEQKFAPFGQLFSRMAQSHDSD